VPARDLAVLARERGVPFLHDVGSGALRQHGKLALTSLACRTRWRRGLIWSASAGTSCWAARSRNLVGRKRWIDPLGRHPVARVVRLDKTALAALEATLEAYLDPETLTRRIPLLALLAREWRSCRSGRRTWRPRSARRSPRPGRSRSSRRCRKSAEGVSPGSNCPPGRWPSHPRVEPRGDLPRAAPGRSAGGGKNREGALPARRPGAPRREERLLARAASVLDREVGGSP